MLKVMKRKNFQPKIPYPARLIQISWRNPKLYRQTKVRIQYHQTSFITNGKRTFLGRTYKRKKRPTINKHKTVKKMVVALYISVTISMKKESESVSHSVVSNSF